MAAALLITTYDDVDIARCKTVKIAKYLYTEKAQKFKRQYYIPTLTNKSTAESESSVRKKNSVVSISSRFQDIGL